MQALHFDEICARMEGTKWKEENTKIVQEKTKENMMEICIKCESVA